MSVVVPHVTDMGEVVYGRVDRLSPLVRRVICENPNHFTYRGTATFLVGRGEVAVIDPGPAYEPHLRAVLGALEPGERVTAIAITHTHGDHSPGAAWLAATTGAPTYGFGPHGAVRDAEERIDFSSHFTAAELVDLERRLDEIPHELRREAPDVDFAPDHQLADGDGIEGPGWSLEAVWTPGHCSNHLCYALAEEATLFSGDHVMGWATSVVGPPDGSMRDYLASLDRLLTRSGDERYRPTHGPEIDDPHAYVRALVAHRRDREAQLLDALGDAPRRIVDVVPELYAGYDRLLWYPAAASVHAHLLALVEEGRVTVADGTEPRLDSTYRRV